MRIWQGGPRVAPVEKVRRRWAIRASSLAGVTRPCSFRSSASTLVCKQTHANSAGWSLSWHI